MKTQHQLSAYQGPLRRLIWAGVLALVLFGGTVGAWAALTEIAGAVVTEGHFVVDGNVKKVQHQTGGIVGQLNVKEGEYVAQDAIVIRLDDTVTKANLQVIVRQIDEIAARSTRLRAERDKLEEFPGVAEFADRLKDPFVKELSASEANLFYARRNARDVQRQQLGKRIGQLQDEITGLKSEQLARDRQAVLIEKELESVLSLYDRNLIPLTRKNALEREVANLDGQKGQLIASVARTEGKIAETELQIQQIDDVLREEVVKELREIEGKSAELVERRVAAEDQLKRVDLRAPAAGYVHQLAVHTVGGVITPAEPAMLIVPQLDVLQVEARVLPHDIDQIVVGQQARIRILAFNQRTTPELVGSVTLISADTTADPRTGLSYYTIRVALPQEQLRNLGPQKVTAGMQANVFVTTGERTPLQFIVKPLQDQIAKAFRER